MTEDATEKKSKESSTVRMSKEAFEASAKLVEAYGRGATTKFIVEQCVIQMAELAFASERTLPQIIVELDFFRRSKHNPVRFPSGEPFIVGQKKPSGPSTPSLMLEDF